MTLRRSLRLFFAALAVVPIFWPATACAADETIAPETVALVKKASVYIRVEGNGWAASGSGFVIAADDKAVLVATNNHVVVTTPPIGGRPGTKPAAISVVFDSGLPTEKSYPADVVARDRGKDLAIIRVTGVKTPPKPIAYENPPLPFETMVVYTFGFPFGKALSVDRGSPAITVGKASVSSLRKGRDGELAYVQIDGNLNPGNSGGPVVDAQGRLVGVAVATIRDGQGIGLTVPAPDLVRMMAGTFGRMRVTPKKTDANTVVQVEIELIDPTGAIREAALHYLVNDPKAKRPDQGTLDKHPDAKKLVLKIDGGMAAGEFQLPAMDGELLVQASAVPPGRGAVATKIRSFHLKSLLVAAGLAGPPSDGWKEFTPTDRTFTLWLPEKSTQQAIRSRTTSANFLRLRVNSVSGQASSGLRYEAQMVELPELFGALPQDTLHELLLTATVDPAGRVTDSVEVTAGALTGQEHSIESGKTLTRARVFVKGSNAFIVLVSGGADLITSSEAEIILASFRPAAAPGKGPAVVAKGPANLGAVVGKVPIVLGSLGAEFKEMAPEGGLLVGFELGLANSSGRDTIRAVKPIFRVGDKELAGNQHGTQMKKPVKIAAKPGYAVGAVSLKHGQSLEGMSITFMKVGDGKLDPSDSYESEFMGSDEDKPSQTITGNGAPVFGIVGKTINTDVSGLGLLFKGQEGYEIPGPKKSGPTGTAARKIPLMYGGDSDPEFKDLAPEGGLLVGFEIGLAKESDRDVIQAVKPIFRVGDKETTGQQRGTQMKKLVTIKAKPGYAVGAISVKHGQSFDGMSVTFMKVRDGKLELSDRYDSEFVGGDEEQLSQRIGGNGIPVLGIVGRSNTTNLTGIGLIFKGQEGYEPKADR